MSIAGTQTVHPERLSYGGPGVLWGCNTLGTIDSSFAPTVAASKFTQGNTTGGVPGNALFLPFGDLGAPTGIDYSITVEELDVENSLEVVVNLVTKRMLTINATLSDHNLSTYGFIMNAPGSAWNGTPSASGAAKFTPVNPGSEAHLQLVWESVALDDLVVVYKALQVGSVSEKHGKGKSGQSTWAVSFKGELPDSTVATTLFTRYLCGTARAATVSGDV